MQRYEQLPVNAPPFLLKKLIYVVENEKPGKIFLEIDWPTAKKNVSLRRIYWQYKV